jgi:hypothetical protein
MDNRLVQAGGVLAAANAPALPVSAFASDAARRIIDVNGYVTP